MGRGEKRKRRGYVGRKGNKKGEERGEERREQNRRMKYFLFV